MARKPKNEQENQDKQEEILTAAVSVFAEKGFAGATTSEVAKAAGVAEGTIFRYFRTKKDLLTAIVIKFVNLFSGDMVLKGIAQIVSESEGKDIRVVLKEILKDRLRLLHRVQPAFQVVITEALYHPEIRSAIYENLYKKALAIVLPLFERLESEGSLRPGLSRDTVVRTIMGTFMGLIAQSVFTNMSEDAFDLEADRTIDLLYHGLIRQESLHPPHH